MKKAIIKEDLRKEYAKLLGERLKTVRQNIGIRQAEVAEKIDVHLSTYSNYERGKQLPDAYTIMKFCKTLQADPSRLLSSGEGLEKINTVVTAVSEFKAELLEIITKRLLKNMADTEVSVPADKQAKLITYAYEQLSRDWDELKVKTTVDKLFRIVA